MSPLPARFTSRWDNPARQSYDDAVCWHLLLGGDPAVRAAATAARQRLASFTGLHMTPLQWLHVTVLRVGTADLVPQDEMSRMLARAQAELARTAPVTVTLQRVFYHPEAIALSVSPASALAPVLEAARAATREVLGADALDSEVWHGSLVQTSAASPGTSGLAHYALTVAIWLQKVGSCGVQQFSPFERWPSVRPLVG